MLSVIIPVYNQEKTIEATINKINSITAEKEIIVVNDCSKDNTESVLKGISLDSLKVIHHVSSRGRAAAALTGAQNATGEFIIIQPDNLTLDTCDYLKLLETARGLGADIVLGSRFSKTQQGVRVAKAKSYFLATILNILFGVQLHDWFTHCQLIRRESFLNLAPQLRGTDTPFEILTRALRKKMRVMEVPVCDD